MAQYFEPSTDTDANFANSISTQANSFFLPSVYSKKVLNFFRKASVCEAITNTDYAGEITAYGDSVKIILEPVITVDAYTRGATVSNQALPDNEITIEIDKANKFAFAVDDIEEKLSHVNWESLATGSATYALKNAYDREVLEFMATGAQDANIVNPLATGHDDAQATANAITLGFGGSDTDSLNLFSLLSLKLDEA